MSFLDEFLPNLTNTKVFSMLDAMDGFHQVQLDESSTYLTTFWTPFETYRYFKMQFEIHLDLKSTKGIARTSHWSRNLCTSIGNRWTLEKYNGYHEHSYLTAEGQVCRKNWDYLQRNSKEPSSVPEPISGDAVLPQGSNEIEVNEIAMSSGEVHKD